MVKDLEDVGSNSKLKQGVEKLHELAGVDIDLSEWTIFTHLGDERVENGYNDTCEKIIEGLDPNIYSTRQNGTIELYYDAKKNITTFDVANGEYRLTDYKAHIREGTIVVWIDG